MHLLRTIFSSGLIHTSENLISRTVNVGLTQNKVQCNNVAH